jgi:signal transduction histidine kinase/ligand-binding sensor domain-containing protein
LSSPGKLGLGLFFATTLLALDPHKALTQYTRAVWTQAEGLPQDTIRAITQTSDGYLWVGTDEGLARFDGYDFVTFTKDDGSLPSTTITALAADKDGALWIGTPNGLSRYANLRFTTFKVADGLPDNAINSLLVDHTGTLWIVAGISLSSYRDGKFFEYPAARLSPVKAARVIYEDQQETLWIGGLGGLVKRVEGTFVSVLESKDVDGEFVNALIKARNGDLWVGGSKGLMLITPSGKRKRYDTRDGLPDDLVRALWEDRGGNLWVGTDEGLSRLEDGRFAASALDGGVDRDWVRCLFEDREGNLWVGRNSGLTRFRDDRFTIYGRAEGLPSDEPIAVHQDRHGVIWIGYHDDGLVAFHDGKFKVYTSRDGLSSDEIFSIRESRNGDLLISTEAGLSRMHDGRFSKYVVPDPLGREPVFDALEDRHGQLWVGGSAGVFQMTAQGFRNIIPSAPVRDGNALVLSESPDGAIWAGTYANGLWQIKDGKTRRFDTSDGLGSNQIHSLYQDPDGALWIGTFGAGLNEYRNGVFTTYAAKDGLLSDNVSHIDDDGQGSLWLSTTRGISRVSKQQLRDFAAGRIRLLTPANYGLDDGLRSTQCAPGYPAGGGGTRTADGRLWFPTSRGLAVINPGAVQATTPVAPLAQILEMNLDGQDIDLHRPAVLEPGPGHIQFRYTGILLSAPERVRYSYKLDGFDRDWIPGSTRRVINYNSLRHGKYRFQVRASVPGQASSEASLGIEVLPHLYETQSFRWIFGLSCLACMYGLYQLRLRQIRGRFSLVLEERARMAREIHDTLAQGFVGISSQLDALAIKMNGKDGIARGHLDLARKMARHSLTEARRTVMDLRDSALEDHNLASALSSAARQWTAGSMIPVDIEVTGPHEGLPEDVEQHVLRIAQEAVTNVVKHAGAKRIAIRLEVRARELALSVSDDGCGFEPSDVFLSAGGHFGLLGMRERAERLGGELQLSSQPGAGTQVKITVPLASDTAYQPLWKRRILPNGNPFHPHTHR